MDKKLKSKISNLRIQGKIAFNFLTNIHVHSRGDKCSVLLSIMYDTQIETSIPFFISLENGKCSKITFPSTDQCLSPDKNSESIAVYNRFFFCGYPNFVNKFFVNLTYEFVYDSESSGWSLTKKAPMIATLKGIESSHYGNALTSVYNCIFSVGDRIAQRYDITKNIWQPLPVLSKSRIFSAVFSRQARYIYTIGGFNDKEEENVNKSFEILDIRNIESGWKFHNYYEPISLTKCKCIQPNDKEVMIIGGNTDVVKMLSFDSEETFYLTTPTKVAHKDSLEGTLCAVYWNGSYNILSSSGVFYRVYKTSKKIKTTKNWLETTLKIFPRCPGG